MNIISRVARPARAILVRRSALPSASACRSFCSIPFFETAGKKNGNGNSTLHVPHSIKEDKVQKGEKPVWETLVMTSANATRIVGGTILLLVGDVGLDETLEMELRGLLFSLDGKLPMVTLSGNNLKELPQIARALQLPADNKCALFLLSQGRIIDSLYPLNFPPEDQQEMVQAFVERLASSFGSHEKLAHARVRAGSDSPGTAAMNKGQKLTDEKRFEDAIEQYQFALQQPEVNGELRVQVQCLLARTYMAAGNVQSAQNLLNGLPDVPCVRGAQAMVDLVDDTEFIANPYETARAAIAALKKQRTDEARQRILRYLAALNDPNLRKEFNKVWFI
eukprot:GEMP01080421.1.p1 GENE.GEMP01080421.1~~GEMP01080421.1.p1  ORF type:complete len:336 (+),score=63.19 GEMP01080421.1:16-1023(+)